MIKSWTFEFFPAPRELEHDFDPKKSAEYFNWFLDLWPRAEQLGFEGIFFSEHHFGPAYSPAPNLLIAQMALKTKTLRLGVMGMVAPYHAPWQLFEEVGMLDHMTGGRIEIGTAAGIPQEMAQIGMGTDEARERNDEALEILDAALRSPVISHHGKYWNFDNLRLVPRPLQQPSPPVWVTVVSVSSARKAARRGVKICTGFSSIAKIKEIFDAYRDEAATLGKPATPDHFAIRRQVTIARDDATAREAGRARAEHFKSFITVDPRVPAPGRKVLDTPSAHAFTIGEEEFVVGNPASVAEQAIAQCRELGCGHFMSIFDRGTTREELAEAWNLFGAEVNPALRRAEVARARESKPFNFQ
jgi:alkanesulfonate monooxygenase SsuD/methylene tetrahydromethanopterin reductase-like flavin-dependent oxidoreductase (luciferase family)